MHLKRRRSELSSCTGSTSNRIRGHAGLTLGLAACLSRPTAAFVSPGPSVLLSPRSSGSLWSSTHVSHLDRPAITAAVAIDQEEAFLVRDFQTVGNTDRSAIDIHQQVGTALADITPIQPAAAEAIQDKQAVSTATTAPPTAIATTKSASTLKRWKRRLATREDWKHTHKITGVLFLLASWGLTAYGLCDFRANGWTQPVSRHGKPFVGLLLLLLSTTVLQSFSSISMACRYRRNQPAVRNTFLCNAAVAILGSVSALWSSPWYPTALNGAPSMKFYLVMNAIGLIGIGDNLVRLRTLIASRQTTTSARKQQQVQGLQYWRDVFVYIMPILIGAPFFVAIGCQFGIRHDRTFYLKLLQSERFPHLEAGAVYGMVMVAMGASYSSLIVTLRDKKLIRKRTEGLSLTAVMVCLLGSLYQALRDPGAIAALIRM